MPEGPESQVLVNGLKKLTQDRWITSVHSVGGRYVYKKIPGMTQGFVESRHLVENIRRHGKAIVFDLSTHDHIVVTLGMTGKFSLVKEKHAAVRFEYGDVNLCAGGTEGKDFYFVDQRRFGTVRIIPSDKLESTLPKMGWDALDDELDVQRVDFDLRDLKKGTVIGSALLNGSVFSGIGNYLRAEILYEAGVSPWKACSDLSEQNVEDICKQARKISRRSFLLGGNTIENFVDLEGGSGKFFEELKVYGKRKDPDGNEVLAEKTPEGRTIHWVPNVQKM